MDSDFRQGRKRGRILKGPGTGQVAALGGTSLGAAAVAVGVAQIELSGQPQAHVWSNVWLLIALALAFVGLAITFFLFVTSVYGRDQAESTKHDRSGKSVLGRRPQQRATMLKLLHNCLITEQLEPSLAGLAEVNITLRRRWDLAQSGSRLVSQPYPPPTQTFSEASIDSIFDRFGGGLLIVGAPGAGKSTLLLKLAKKLLERAAADRDQPIPVVLNLASWAAGAKPMADWLTDELAGKYPVPRRVASAWVEHEQIALLLDGLDEVAEIQRRACADAINAYRADHGLTPMVVCSRVQEFDDMDARLNLNAAVELQPLSDEQVAEHLDKLERAGVALADIRSTIANDPGIRELLRSPLMLHVLLIAYDGQSIPDLANLNDTDRGDELLWKAYVDRMFEQRPLSQCGYTSEKAVLWLEWIAWNMRNMNLSEFRIDRLTPDWLVPSSSRRSLGYWIIKAIQKADPSYMFMRVMSWDTFNNLDRTLMDSIHAVRMSITATVIASLVVGLAALQAVGVHASSSRSLLTFIVSVVLAFAIYAVISFFFLGVVSYWSHDVSDRLVRPPWTSKQEIWRSGIHGIAAGVTAAPIFGVVTAFGLWLYIRSYSELILGIGVGFFFGFCYGLAFGGLKFIQHCSVSVMLVRGGYTPRHYEAFLGAMAERLLLRRSGSGYTFAHQLLRDHFAKRLENLLSSLQEPGEPAPEVRAL